MEHLTAPRAEQASFKNGAITKTQYVASTDKSTIDTFSVLIHYMTDRLCPIRNVLYEYIKLYFQLFSLTTYWIPSTTPKQSTLSQFSPITIC